MALLYWFSVFPRTRREQRRWRRRALGIPDPVLRALALQALELKRGNTDGASAFATLVPRAQRGAAVRLLVAWQAAYDYADTLSEQASPDRSANGRLLHRALLNALTPGAGHVDYYARHRGHESSYLSAMVETARSTFASLPNHGVVERRARAAAQRIVDFQALNHGRHQQLAGWALAKAPSGAQLYWWETAAAGASSLVVLALLAAATERDLDTAELDAIENAYFPWIGALHTLLDSLVDLRQDAEDEQPSLLDHYRSRGLMAERMQLLAKRSLDGARALPNGRRHALLLVGMAGLYLSSPEAADARALPASRAVSRALGASIHPSLLVHRARRRALGLVRQAVPLRLGAHQEHGEDDQRDGHQGPSHDPAEGVVVGVSLSGLGELEQALLAPPEHRRAESRDDHEQAQADTDPRA
jgi:tetraprenyl-beta-curcumene synthase